MRGQVFPTKLISYRRDILPRELDQLIDRQGVIARVTIRTRTPEYPFRNGERIAYPIGTFTTTLTGPELVALRADGEVISCHELATYRIGDALRAAAQVFIANRDAADSVADAGQMSFAKLLSNSIAGKLAQRKGNWRRCLHLDSAGEWGEWYERDLREGTRTRYRRVCGFAWRWDDDAVGRGPHTYAFAYLAAYGRLQMRRFRQSLPEKSVVSQDTDGMWILQNGIEALGPLPGKDDAKPGQLRIVDSGDTGTFYTPRHYQVDGKWVLSGFHSQTPDADGKHVWDTTYPIPWSGKFQEAPTWVQRVDVKKAIPTTNYGSRYGEDGWAIPRVIDRNSFESPPRLPVL